MWQYLIRNEIPVYDIDILIIDATELKYNNEQKRQYFNGQIYPA